MIGTALGINYVAINFGYCLFPVVVGFIQENTDEMHGFFYVSVFLAFLGGVGLATAVVSYILDIQKGAVLNAPDPLLAEEAYQAGVVFSKTQEIEIPTNYLKKSESVY